MLQVYTLFCIVAMTVSTSKAGCTDEFTETLYVKYGGNTSVTFYMERFVVVLCYKNDDEIYDSDEPTRYPKYMYEKQTNNYHRLHFFNVDDDDVVDRCTVLGQRCHYDFYLNFKFYEMIFQIYPNDVIPSTDAIDIEKGFAMAQCISKTSFEIMDLTVSLSGPGIISKISMLLNNYNVSDGFYESVYTALIHVDRNRVEYTTSCFIESSKIGGVEIIPSHEVGLHVLYEADFTNLDELENGFVANEGDDVRLVCSGTGNPDNVTYRWTKIAGSELSKSSLLSIRNASCEKDQGLYICTISNGVGEPKSAVTNLNVKCTSVPPQHLLNFVSISNITCYSMDIQWNEDTVNRSENIFIHVEYSAGILTNGTWISSEILTNGTWKSSESDVQKDSHRVNPLQPGAEYKLRIYVHDDKNRRIGEQILFATTKCCMKCSDLEENTGSQSDFHGDVTFFEICIMVGAFLIGCFLSGFTVHCCKKHSNVENRVKTQRYMTYLPKRKEDTFYQEINKGQYMMSINPMTADSNSITREELPATDSEYLSPQEDHIYECAKEARGTP